MGKASRKKPSRRLVREVLVRDGSEMRAGVPWNWAVKRCLYSDGSTDYKLAMMTMAVYERPEVDPGPYMGFRFGYASVAQALADLSFGFEISEDYIESEGWKLLSVLD